MLVQFLRLFDKYYCSQDDPGHDRCMILARSGHPILPISPVGYREGLSRTSAKEMIVR
jgi:hypothetical protein